MKRTVTVMYVDDDKYAVADLNVEKWFEAEIQKDDATIYVGTQNMLTRLRVAVRHGQLLIDKVIWNDIEIPCGGNGDLAFWPDDFCISAWMIKSLLSGKSREESMESMRQLKERARQKRANKN